MQSPNHPVAHAVQHSADPVSPEKLGDMVRECDVRILEDYGGIDGLLDRLCTSLDNGILNDPRQIQKRQQEFGANTCPGLSSKDFFRFLLVARKDRVSFYIILLAVQSFPHGMKTYCAYEVPTIAILGFLLELVVASMHYRQGLQFVRNKNEEMQSRLVNVVRGGSRMQIPVSGLVVGDIAFLEAEDQVPADGLLAEPRMLCVDASTMTGESGSIPVNEQKRFLLSGCKVIRGSGKMLVTGVGMKTEWGRLMVDPQEEAAMRVGLNGFTAFVSGIRLAGGALLFSVFALLMKIIVAPFPLNFTAAVFVEVVALIAVQMVWASLLKDTVGVLAFETEHI